MLTVADFVRLDVEIQLYGSARRSNVPPCSHKSSQSACGQRVLRAPQVLHVLVADGHKPADDGRRVARAALQQRKLIARKRAWKLFMGTNGNNIARH